MVFRLSHKLDAETTLRYAIPIADALTEAHEKGIVHRDIKPGNIMVDAKDRIKVMDFGLARLADSRLITKTGTTLGTMVYMAPEQIQGRRVDHRADLFSFGVLLFEMLTGNPPFQGRTTRHLRMPSSMTTRPRSRRCDRICWKHSLGWSDGC